MARRWRDRMEKREIESQRERAKKLIVSKVIHRLLLGILYPLIDLCLTDEGFGHGIGRQSQRHDDEESGRWEVLSLESFPDIHRPIAAEASNIHTTTANAIES